MTAAEARYYRASRSCRRGWEATQPQMVLDGWADELDSLDVKRAAESASGGCCVQRVEPACLPQPGGLTVGADTTGRSHPPLASVARSAPLTNDGRDALLSGNERRGQEVTLDVR